MKFLYINENEVIRDVYTMMLDANYNAQVIEASSLEEGLDLLRLHDNTTLVICAMDLEPDKGCPIYHHIREKLLEVPYIYIGNSDLATIKEFSNFQKDNPGNRVVPVPVDQAQFKLTMVEVLSHVQGEPWTQPLIDQNYAQVKAKNFLRVNTIPCDVFIKLSDRKFVKLIEKNGMYGTDIVQKYMDKGIEHLHVYRDQYTFFADYCSRLLIQLYGRKKKGDITIANLQLASLEDVHQNIHDRGLTEETIQLTKKTMEASLSAVKSTPGVWKLINNMEKTGGYIYDHSLQVSFVAIAIAKMSEWNSDGTCYKLSLAALMHDMTLENHELAKIQTLDDPRLEQYDDEVIEDYKQHASKASLLVKDIKNFPSDVDFIIDQHHERPAGNGFPKGLSKNRIAPLACLFILAHEFVSRVDTQHNGQYSPEVCSKIIEDLKSEEYNRGNFKKPFEGLVKAFSKS